MEKTRDRLHATIRDRQLAQIEEAVTHGEQSITVQGAVQEVSDRLRFYGYTDWRGTGEYSYTGPPEKKAEVERRASGDDFYCGCCCGCLLGVFGVLASLSAVGKMVEQ